MPEFKVDKTHYEQVLCIVILNSHQFSSERRREWFIWAAKTQRCGRCDQPEYRPCLNLTRLKAGEQVSTKWPHDGRVDWSRFLKGLIERGLWSPALDTIARRRLKE